MNILYIQDQEIDYFNGRYYHSKSEHFFSRFLAGTSDNDTLIVCAGVKETNDECKVAKYKDITNPRIKYVQVPEFRKFGNIVSIFKLIKKVIKGADYCYLRSGIASSFAAYFCNKLHIPYMAVVNENVYKSAKSHSNILVRLTALPLYVMVRYMVKNANAAVYVTQRYLQDRYPCKGEMLGCSDIEFLELNVTNLEKRIKKIDRMSHPIILGSVGSVATKIKGQDTVVRALAELKKDGYKCYKYKLVGPGDKSILTDLANSLGVDDMIEFMGEYSHDNVIKWFEDIDIYLHPSRSEGLPRTILEAMTKAVPCICSAVGGIPELINNEYLFSYNGNEVQAVKNLILKMTKENMLVEAQRNFNNSLNYDPQLLEQRRNRFFKKFLGLKLK